MRGIIGVPHTGSVTAEFFKCFIGMHIPAGVEFVEVAKSAIHVAREMIAAKCIREGYDWVLFIDDDMTFPPNIIEQLLSHDAPIVSAMCFKRITPYTPCFYEKCELKEGGIYLKPYDLDEVPTETFMAEAAGAACMLIKREVFEKIPAPWFLPLPFSGEDIAFCIKAKAAGYGILIDPKPIIGHIETRPINIYTYLAEKMLTEGAF